MSASKAVHRGLDRHFSHAHLRAELRVTQGAMLAWLGLLLGIVVGLSFPEFRFLRYWSWLGYCSCLPVVWVFISLMTLADETRPRKR